MKTRRVVIYLAIWLGATFGLAAAAESQAPAEGAPLPEFTLPAQTEYMFYNIFIPFLSD